MSARPLLLDLFCCQGGASRGYVDAGFDVVGVDLEPQPRYPFPFVQADALELLRGWLRDGGVWLPHLSRPVAVHASPPCQGYSDTQRIMDSQHPKLIADVRTLLVELGLPFVIENVPGARGDLIDPFMLCGAMFDGLRVYRHRYFEASFPVEVPSHPPHVAKQVKMGRRPAPGEWVQAVGNFSGVAEARQAMAMPWASRDGLREAIPPAYTEWVGLQLMSHLAASPFSSEKETAR